MKMDRETKLSMILAKLTKNDKKFLIKTLEEVSETSYRRGVHQALEKERGCYMRMIPILRAENGKGISSYRYKNMKKCVGIDGFESTKGFRLTAEHPFLEDLYSDAGVQCSE